MQRSITHKKPLVNFLYIALFVIYESLTSIYLFLPPLFGVLFVFFYKALKDEDTFFLVLVIFCLMVFEADKGYMLFSSVLFFAIIYKFILPKIIYSFNCSSCIKISFVFMAYIGYYLFLLLLSKIFLTTIPSLNYYIVYYIVIEFFLVSLL